jgi:hypothetical protein
MVYKDESPVELFAARAGVPQICSSQEQVRHDALTMTADAGSSIRCKTQSIRRHQRSGFSTNCAAQQSPGQKNYLLHATLKHTDAMGNP